MRKLICITLFLTLGFTSAVFADAVGVTPKVITLSSIDILKNIKKKVNKGKKKIGKKIKSLNPENKIKKEEKKIKKEKKKIKKEEKKSKVG
ncbi:MAG: hypothetical protein HOI80_05375 [Alphaproteobacteria bacterium]|nr:hypothetical protein [Alphaproteobacteria bacterium]MBT5389460.1 hypothetical protein [Alphaproteobacteria bacterium]MBT5540495.1 hypothetical protein [Alphaproteobacteria bacterium]MBT5654906.1 hypothetical protein [Alphaproteobacteria bacterium]